MRMKGLWINPPKSYIVYNVATFKMFYADEKSQTDISKG